MNRIDRVILLILCLWAATSPAYHAYAENKKPNVLFIAIDDLNDWVGCLGGHPDVKSPHIDKLASQGRNFTNAHCVVPVCSPSRISVMSGVHAITHGSYEIGPNYIDLTPLDDAPTIQGYFKTHGYKTYSGGKVLHHGFSGRLKADIDVQYAKGKGGPKPKKPLNWPATAGSKAWDWGPYPDSDDKMMDYQMAQKAAAILKEKHDQPFFLSVGIYRPHVAMLVPPKWFDLYDRDKIAMPDDTPPDHAALLPDKFKGRTYIEPVHQQVIANKAWRGMVHAYLASVSFADMCVGAVMDGLNNGPNRDNTIVILWSDHGFHLGEKQKWAKRMLWEESTRTPFIIAGPGIKPGDCQEAVSLLDIYPTLVSYCKLPDNAHLEGTDLTPQLNDPMAARTKPVLTSSFYGNHTLRDRDWRYTRYAGGQEELYDHRNDPHERRNLAKNPEFDEIKRKLASYLPKEIAPEKKGQQGGKPQKKPQKKPRKKANKNP